MIEINYICKMKRLFLWLWVGVLLGGCIKEANVDRKNVPVYRIDYKSEVSDFWDDYFEYSHHIVLETIEESALNRINKLIVHDNRIYILCGGMKSVFIFDKQGQFIRRINRVGKGPGEYLSAEDMIVTPDGEIELLDGMSGKINAYTSDGEWIASKECLRAEAFLRVDKDKYLFNRNNRRTKVEEPEPFNLCYVDGDSVKVRDLRYVPCMAGKSYRVGEGNSLMYDRGMELLIPNNDTLYAFNKKKLCLERVAYFDFRVVRPDENMSKEEVRKYIKECDAGEIPTSLYSLYRMGDYLYGLFNYQKTVKQVLISLEDKTVLIGKSGINKDRIPILLVPYTELSTKEEYILSLLPASYVKAQEGLKKGSLLYTINRELESEECNPVLVFYKMKH